MEFIDVLGLVAGICTSSSVIPQLIKTVKSKKAQDVSLFMFIVLLTGNSLWIYYGFHKTDVAIISTNILALCLNIVMLFLKYRYKDRGV
jgi:MtN3 and saliva related transmembrane protein